MKNSILPATINLFVNSRCNFRCRHCYATFHDIADAKLPQLSVDEAMRIIQMIAVEPLGENMQARKITFVGGEPTLYPGLLQLVSYAKQYGLVTALISNGLTLSPGYLQAFRNQLDWVVLSIDGLTANLNLNIGRNTAGGRHLDAEAYLARTKWVSGIGARLKINTVVSRLNCGEDYSDFMVRAMPLRWKILQVMPVAGQNDEHIKILQISSSEFESFVSRHLRLEASGIRIVGESVETIRGSYAMVSPDGRFFDSSSGEHRYSRRIVDVGVSTAFGEVKFDVEKFHERDGDYNPLTGQPRSVGLTLAA